MWPIFFKSLKKIESESKEDETKIKKEESETKINKALECLNVKSITEEINIQNEITLQKVKNTDINQKDVISNPEQISSEILKKKSYIIN